MQVEVGSIVEGKVTGITHFGAFIALTGGQTGMVHISEISNSYVKEISDYLSEDQDVKVKVLSIADDGKISLSIKRCEENVDKNNADNRNQRKDNERRSQPQPQQRRNNQPPAEAHWGGKDSNTSGDVSFEDMLSKFKQNSNDRMSDLKRANEHKRSRRSGAGR